MVLERLFGPRLGHPDPQIRVEAIAQLPPTAAQLDEVLRMDQHPDVRRAALGRTVNLETLSHAAEQESDPDTRALAAARYRQLLAGLEQHAPGLETRLGHLTHGCSERLASFLVRHGAENELRLATLPHVRDEALLCEVAIHDDSADVRLAAVARIRGEASLARVAKEVRERDKRVSRTAAEHLSQILEARQRRSEADQLCNDMDELCTRDPGPVEAAEFQRLEHAWARCAAEKSLRERYQQARDRFRARLEQQAHARRVRAQVCARLEAVLHELQAGSAPSPELETRCEEALAAAQTDWSRYGKADASEDQRLRSLEESIRQCSTRLRAVAADAQPFETLIAEAQAMSDSAARVRPKQLRTLDARWAALTPPSDERLAASLHESFQRLRSSLQDRQRRETEAEKVELDGLRERIEVMEGAIARGELKEASDIYGQIRQALDALQMPARKQQRLRARLHKAEPRLAELRSWRRWGTNRARERLCEEAEQLIGCEEHPSVLAKKVRGYREGWKELDHSEGGASRALWERFNRACTRAYAPCEEYFGAQAREREANREQKETLLAELEAFERDTDWDQVNWRQADETVHKAQRAWRAIGPVDRRRSKALSKRQREVLGRLEARLGPERERERERRKALIEEIRALAGADDLGGAARRVKQARGSWAPTVPARRNVERALWREFTAACDAVFERLHGERGERAAQARMAMAERERLCETVEAQAEALGHATPETVERAMEEGMNLVRKAEREFAACGQVPREDRVRVSERFNKAIRGFRETCRAQRTAIATARLEALAQRAASCAELEHAALGETPPETLAQVVEQARIGWAELPHVEAEAARALEQRFASACAAAGGDAQARARLRDSLETNLERKLELCLQLEVMAGIDSPPEFAQARLAYQVDRLRASLKGDRPAAGDRRQDDPRRQLERDWYLTGATPAAGNAELEARFRRALAALPPER